MFKIERLCLKIIIKYNELGYEEGYDAGFDDGFADSGYYDSEEEE